MYKHSRVNISHLPSFIQVSHAESSFEFYFSLTKADGDVLDVVAAQSGFLPSGPAPVHSDHLQKDLTLIRPDNNKPAGMPDHYDSGPWVPACVSRGF
jgi:hypothetical protein